VHGATPAEKTHFKHPQPITLENPPTAWNVPKYKDLIRQRQILIGWIDTLDIAPEWSISVPGLKTEN
jgi:hypothetical protein